MDKALSLAILERIKSAAIIRSDASQAFLDAANQAANANIRSEATGDIGRLGLAMLGIGAATRGGMGLAAAAKRNLGQGLRTRSGPTVLTMPYPVEPEEDPEKQKKPKVAADRQPRQPSIADLPMAFAGGGGALGGVLGGLYGVAKKKPIIQNAARGALLGGGTGLGVTAGGVLGGLGGAGLGALAGYAGGGETGALGGAGLGGLAGAGLGALAGGRKGYTLTRDTIDEDDDSKTANEKRADATDNVLPPILGAAGAAGGAAGGSGIGQQMAQQAARRHVGGSYALNTADLQAQQATQKRILSAQRQYQSWASRRARGAGQDATAYNKMNNYVAQQRQQYGAQRSALNQQTIGRWGKTGGRWGGVAGLALGGLGGMLAGQAVTSGTNMLAGGPTQSKAALDKAALDITRKTAIPWYRPAMALTGIGGMALGWKGVDAVLDRQQQKARDKEVSDARQEFHDALLAQYAKPLSSLSHKAAGDETDALYERLGRVFDGLEKMAGMVKEGGRLGDIAGEGAGMYGTYAALSGLATGALVYEQARKRQRRSILDKAMKRRERRRFNTSPPEIMAVPEPVRAVPKTQFKEDMQLISNPEGGLE